MAAGECASLTESAGAIETEFSGRFELSDQSTIIVADDHPLFREALIRAIGNCVAGVRIVEADSFDTLQNVVEAHSDADLLFLDLNMPGVSGFSALIYIRNIHASLPTVIVSAIDDPAIICRSIQHGASGFIPKSSPIGVLEQGIRAVLDGEIWVPTGIDLNHACLDNEEARIAAAMSSLTPHQFRVLMMVCEGLLNKQIAYRLGTSETTIKAHVSAILRKMNVHNRTQAMLAVEQLRVNGADFPEERSGRGLSIENRAD